MKTIYNVKALCVVALLGSAAAASAQEDVTKEKNLNREMTLEREYDPSVQDASKVNTLPVVKEPEVRKIPIDYSNYTIAADPRKEISLLPSGNIMTQMDYNKRRGYFNFGMGTRMNINGDLGYHILSTEKDKLNIWYSHRSTNGKPMDSDVKAKINDNLGGIGFKHVFDKTILSLGAKYGYSGFNYYGSLPLDLRSSYMPPAELLERDRETNQVNQTIAATIGFESKEDAPFGYLLDLGYTNFSHKYGLSKEMDGPTEHTFEAKFDLNAGFNGNMKIGLGGLVEYFSYNLPEVVGFPFYEFKNHAEAMLSPYYKVEGDNWNIKLGANVMMATGDETRFMASPNIAADVEVADKTELYMKAGGKLYSNSMYEMSRVNRYLYPMDELEPSRNWLDAILGIRSGVAPGFWFDVFAGYKITSNDVLFNQMATFNSGDFSNFSEAMSDIDTKQLFIGANLKYSYQRLFDVSLKGVYNNWKANLGDSWSTTSADTDLDHAWGKPEMEINANVTVRPIDKLSIALDYYLATGRYARVLSYYATPSSGNTFNHSVFVEKMNNINELNLTGTYTFNDTFCVYAKLSNILCQKYEVYYGYPMQSFNAMLGVNINF
ncbi:MAG: TonB-dependent receptor [Parabacteroides sp.]|nr:TonB-dependent receptor [Parabacteroides sp.]